MFTKNFNKIKVCFKYVCMCLRIQTYNICTDNIMDLYLLHAFIFIINEKILSTPLTFINITVINKESYNPALIFRKTRL